MKKTYKEQFMEALHKEKLKYDKLTIDILRTDVGNYTLIQRRWLSMQYHCRANKLHIIRNNIKSMPASLFVPKRFPSSELLSIKLAVPEIQI